MAGHVVLVGTGAGWTGKSHWCGSIWVGWKRVVALARSGLTGAVALVWRDGTGRGESRNVALMRVGSTGNVTQAQGWRRAAWIVALVRHSQTRQVALAWGVQAGIVALDGKGRSWFGSSHWLGAVGMGMASHIDSGLEWSDPACRIGQGRTGWEWHVALVRIGTDRPCRIVVVRAGQVRHTGVGLAWSEYYTCVNR